jgi:DNA-binding NarL/FixJ family response regulator
MIRVVVVDDHPAVRAGLMTVLRAEPGIVPVGEASTAAELWPQLQRAAPDVVLLDYHLPDADGLRLCRRVKAKVPAPAVLVYSAYVDATLVIPARLAGADGLVHKSAPALELYEALRTVAGGGRVMPEVSREMLEQASERVDPQDLPVLSMLVDGATPADVAAAMRIEGEEVSRRIDRLLSRLRVDVPASA